MELQVKREIEELHKFFVSWFNGDLRQTEENFSSFKNTLTSDFQIITPQGKIFDRAGILAAVWESHSSRKNDISEFNIWIENIKIRLITSKTIIATYQELQQTAEGRTSRISTVVFKVSTDQSGKLFWQHLHETWIPQN